MKTEHFALIFYVLASTCGVVIIKKFFDSVHHETITDFLSGLLNVQLIIGVALYMTGFLTWLYILSRMDLNTAYPVAISLSFIAVILASALVLKEPLTVNIGIGTVLCFIGVFIILR
ncbi:MAG: EamA family transporter [Methanoregula sp.]|nr:EamA family transporter [Methanoregula sp.]